MRHWRHVAQTGQHLYRDLGQPWRIWHALVYWNPHSVLFEVSWCVMLYTTVLALEFAPIVFERLRMPPEYACIPNVFVKRDDLTGLATSGNKIRKLEFCMAEAEAAGAEVILPGMQIPTNYGSSYTAAFTAVYPELAKQYRVDLVDFFLERVALDLDLIQPDGIHPTAEAQPLLLENVWPVLEKKLRKQPKTAAR